MAEIFKFPYDACRRVHSKKPRRSKNGTPEERAAKAAALLPPPADIVSMSTARAAADSDVDGRKLRGSPLRDLISTVSFGATVVGKMHTAGLKHQPLAEIDPEIRKEWLATLSRAEDALCSVAIGFEKAVRTLMALESEISHSPVNLPESGLGQSVLNLAAEPTNSAPERA
jgi:hypothetical protein